MFYFGFLVGFATGGVFGEVVFFLIVRTFRKSRS